MGDRDGVPYWQLEATETTATGLQHTYARTYERDKSHKIVAAVALPPARWATDQKLLREMLDNVQIHR